MAWSANFLVAAMAFIAQLLLRSLSLVYPGLEGSAGWALGVMCVFGAVGIVRALQSVNATKRYRASTAFKGKGDS
jgi:hypothetical protein